LIELAAIATQRHDSIKQKIDIECMARAEPFAASLG